MRCRPPRPRREEIAAKYGVNGWTVTKAFNGLPPYDLPEHGPSRPRYERARDERFEAEHEGRPIVAVLGKAKQKVTSTTAPWQVIRSGGPVGAGLSGALPQGSWSRRETTSGLHLRGLTTEAKKARLPGLSEGLRRVERLQDVANVVPGVLVDPRLLAHRRDGHLVHRDLLH